MKNIILSLLLLTQSFALLGSKEHSAKMFGEEDTFISFIYKPDSFPPEVIVDIPARPECEEKVRDLIGVFSHRTPGIKESQGLSSCTQINTHWLEKHTEIYCFKKNLWIKKEKYTKKDCLEINLKNK